MVIKESKIRSIVRKYLKEMLEDDPSYYETPEEVYSMFADDCQAEDDYFKDYWEDQEADRIISWQKENPYWDEY